MKCKIAELTAYSFLFSILISLSYSCPKGYHGSPCKLCPVNTYKDYSGYAASCTPCPTNSGHSRMGSYSITDCNCFLGYSGDPQNGMPCTIRRCEHLIAPPNGVIRGSGCFSVYSSVCEMECNEGYEPLGSTKRQCIVNPQYNAMEWSGIPLQCTAIRCPFLVVPDADPPTGICTSLSLEYNARCTFTCRDGYRLKGSKERVCQLDKSWSGGPTICEKKYCPKLQMVQAGVTIRPSFCTTGPVPVFLSCHVTCPPGYIIQQGNLPSLPDRNLVCQLNETWSESIPTCRDVERPLMSCPYNIHATSSKGKATAKVLWSIQVTDNSVEVDPNAVIRVQSSHESGQEFPIGDTLIRVNATDETGNTETCVFNIHVIDTEPPSCSFCPADIVQETTTLTVRVYWKRPMCSDNSGIAPNINSNRQIGDLFTVPSTTLVEYTVSDGLNINKNCSFKVLLKVKACTMFPSPRNGALVCDTATRLTVCSAFCKNGADFEFNPPLLYYCSGGKWHNYVIPGPFQVQNAPWPNCSGNTSPSWIKQYGIHQYHYFSGDAHDPTVQEIIKSQFHGLLTSPFVPSYVFCPQPTCNKDKFTVSPGATD